MTAWSLRLVQNPAVAELHRLLGRLRWRLGLERLAQAVSRGYVRGQLVKEPPTDLTSASRHEQS